MSDPKIYVTPGAMKVEFDDLLNFTAAGGDWNEISNEAARMAEERIVVNLGPVHPSMHSAYCLLLELDGEHVREIHGVMGFLHTGIEKNTEYRTWTQGIVYVTCMGYVASLSQEVGYCMAIEKLLGIGEQVSRRANIIGVFLVESQRTASHLAVIGLSLSELGVTAMMTIVFCTREDTLRILEGTSGLRMNYEFMRSRGVLEDVSEGIAAYIRELLSDVRKRTPEMETIIAQNLTFKARFKDVGVLSLLTLMALGQTGPVIKAAGFPWDFRKSQPYYGYKDYEFEMPVYDKSDAYDRVTVCFDKCYQSFRIAYQALDKLDATEEGPATVEDKKIVWPTRLSISTDGQRTAPVHVREVMIESMESLIHHFKFVIKGFCVPVGQACSIVEHARGILGCRLVFSGGTCPYRVHMSDLGFRDLQDLSMIAEGGVLADAIVCLAAIDPVIGGMGR